MSTASEIDEVEAVADGKESAPSSEWMTLLYGPKRAEPEPGAELDEGGADVTDDTAEAASEAETSVPSHIMGINVRELLHQAIDRILDEVGSDANGDMPAAASRSQVDRPALPDNIPIDQLPETARELIRVMGFHPTMELIQAKGGQTLAVPKGKRWRGQLLMEELAEIVGQKAVEALCFEYGGEYLNVPNCKKALGEVRRAFLRSRFDALTTGANAISARAAVNLLSAEFGIANSSVWRGLKGA